MEQKGETVNIIYKIVGWFFMTLVRMAVSIIMMAQAIALLIISPFGSLFEQGFIKVVNNLGTVACTLETELKKEEKAKKKKARMKK